MPDYSIPEDFSLPTLDSPPTTFCELTVCVQSLLRRWDCRDLLLALSDAAAVAGHDALHDHGDEDTWTHYASIAKETRSLANLTPEGF